MSHRVAKRDGLDHQLIQINCLKPFYPAGKCCTTTLDSIPSSPGGGNPKYEIGHAGLFLSDSLWLAVGNVGNSTIRAQPVSVLLNTAPR